MLSVALFFEERTFPPTLSRQIVGLFQPFVFARMIPVSNVCDGIHEPRTVAQNQPGIEDAARRCTSENTNHSLLIPSQALSRRIHVWRMHAPAH